VAGVGTGIDKVLRIRELDGERVLGEDGGVVWGWFIRGRGDATRPQGQGKVY